MAMAAGMALVALGCEQPIAIPGGAELGVTVDEILADPQAYVGRTVVTDGEVGRVVGERVIALRSPTSADEMLAIVNDQAVRAIDAIEPGETLHISGTVQLMSREQIRQVEQQFGIRLDEDKLLNLANQAPFLVAQRVSK